jgi:hypothetical protein
MSSPAVAWEEPASAAPDDAPDPAVLRAERRLRLLEELAEIGMDLARGLRPGAPANGETQANASEGPVAVETARGKGRDPADAFGPLSRAIRLTLALEARTDEELRDLKAGIVRARAEGQTQGAERLRAAAAKERGERIGQIRRLVLGVAETELEDFDAIDDIYQELDERLHEHEAEFGSPERPLRDTVERLCKVFGLNPDWSRWNGEGWAVGDDALFEPFVTASRLSGAGLAEAAGPPSPPTLTPPWRREGAHVLE